MVEPKLIEPLTPAAIMIPVTFVEWLDLVTNWPFCDPPMYVEDSSLFIALELPVLLNSFCVECTNPSSKIWMLIAVPSIIVLLIPDKVPFLRGMRLALVFAGTSSVFQNKGKSRAKPANEFLFCS